jgi:hypothetical protein
MEQNANTIIEMDAVKHELVEVKQELRASQATDDNAKATANHVR